MDDFTRSLRWQLVGSKRVVIWSDGASFSTEEMEQSLLPFFKEGFPPISHLQRRREWLGSRYLTLELIGSVPRTGSYGEPLWPSSWQGSLSHKKGHVALWLGSSEMNAVGIDLEECRTLETELAEKFASLGEIQKIEMMEGGYALLFSAKEALYKALFPFVRRKFWYEAVQLTSVSVCQTDVVLCFQTEKQLLPEFSVGTKILVYGSLISLDSKSYWLTVCSCGPE